MSQVATAEVVLYCTSSLEDDGGDLGAGCGRIGVVPVSKVTEECAKHNQVKTTHTRFVAQGGPGLRQDIDLDTI